MDDIYEEYKEVTPLSRIVKISKEQPMVPLGLAAVVAICGHGAMLYKKRKMKISLFLIEYRLYAQGTLIGCLTLSLAYTMMKKHLWGNNKEKE